ncbi:MAG: TapB family protein [Isosphaeraceae bacterium]
MKARTLISTLLVWAMAACAAAAQTAPTTKTEKTPEDQPARPAREEPARPARDEAARPAIPNYYPLAVGTRWHYQVDIGQAQKQEITLVIAEEETADGKPVSRLEVFNDGVRRQMTEHLMSNENGVFRVRIGGVTYNPPLCLLKYPLKPGQSWVTKTTANDGQQLSAVCKQGAEQEIQVPAGKFRTIPCTIQIDQQTPKGLMRIVNTYWFAENIGVVKQKLDMNGPVVVMELSKFEPPKE